MSSSFFPLVPKRESQTCLKISFLESISKLGFIRFQFISLLSPVLQETSLIQACLCSTISRHTSNWTFSLCLEDCEAYEWTFHRSSTFKFRHNPTDRQLLHILASITFIKNVSCYTTTLSFTICMYWYNWNFFPLTFLLNLKLIKIHYGKRKAIWLSLLTQRLNWFGRDLMETHNQLTFTIIIST